MSGYCIDHDKHFLDTCPSCQEKKEKGPKDCIYKNEDCPICPMARKETCCRKIQCEPIPVPTNPERSGGKGTGEEGMKVESSDTLMHDPEWQKALREQGYRCERGCGNSGCSRCFPVHAKLEWEEEFDHDITIRRTTRGTEGRAYIKSFIRQLRLSSRQSAIEECLDVISTILPSVACEHTRKSFKSVGIGRQEALSALHRLLREESEDKKDV